jgi:uncharacterized membrane protein YdjX (TVP38/TMEM64 family)
VADPEKPVSMDALIDQFSPAETPARRTGPSWGKIVAFISVLLALTLAWRYTPLAEYVDADRVRGWAQSVGNTWWAPLAVVAAYTPSAFVMFPRPLLTIFSVVAFGPFIGFAIAMMGVALSGVCLYYLGRRVSRDTVRRIAGDRLNRTSDLLRRHGLAAAFACSVAPVAPFIAVGIIAGAARVKLGHYIAGMLLGMLPGALATTFFADQLTEALEDPSRINWWIVAGVTAILVALLYGARRWMKKLEAEDRRPAASRRIKAAAA